MARYQVILAYDGTQFDGFQRQGRSSSRKGRTVQGVVEATLRQINWSGWSILAAGRTDTGVHATGQVIAFDLIWEHSPEDLQRALNSLLPFDVAVRDVCLAKPDFHPCFDAVSRRYQYRVYCQAIRDPMKDRFAWRVWPPVDESVLHQATAYFPGTHDFAAFGTPPRPGGSTVRKVFQAFWSKKGQDLVFEIVADAFLYHMVRRMVFLQVAVGQGKQELEAIPQCLGAQDGSSLIKGLAPAQGLVLVEVQYPTRDPDGDGEQRISLENKV